VAKLTSRTFADWPFADPPNVAVFTSVRLLEGEEWVHYVTHDLDDGAWQFHPYSGPTSEKESVIISLAEMLDLEPRISELADLPIGWHAWREKRDAEWMRATNETA
jgi:hypothetical protein